MHLHSSSFTHPLRCKLPWWSYTRTHARSGSPGGYFVSCLSSSFLHPLCCRPLRWTLRVYSLGSLCFLFDNFFAKLLFFFGAFDFCFGVLVFFYFFEKSIFFRSFIFYFEGSVPWRYFLCCFCEFQKKSHRKKLQANP